MTRLGLVLGILLALGAATITAGQGDASLLTTGGAASKLTIADRFKRQSMQAFPEEQALEQSVDPETYVLGSGDLLGVSFRGGLDEFFEVRVSPDGNLLIPLMPMLRVGGMTLRDAADLAQDRWSGDNRSLVVDLTLLEIRTFRAMVSGAVVDPGTFVVTPADRASMLPYLAKGLLNDVYWRDYYQLEMNRQEFSGSFEDLMDRENAPYSSERYAWLERADGSRVHVDLLRIMRTGSRECDPYLKDGDRLVVQYRNELAPTVQVAGAVGYPDTYEWVEGDQLSDMIALAGGFLAQSQKNAVRVTRFDEEGVATVHEVDLSQTSHGFEILPGDLVQVRTIDNRTNRLSVSIVGEVVFPGAYEITFGQTSVQELIELSGGYTEHAFPEAVEVLRKKNINGALDVENQRIVNLGAQGWTIVERALVQFLDRWPDGYERVTVGVPPEGKNEVDQMTGFALQDGDVVHVPSYQHSVLLLGQLERPGWYPFVEGWNYHDYVKAAGGFADDAWKNGRRLVNFNGSVWVRPDGGTVIRPGDTIFIPDKPFRYVWNSFKDILLVLTQAATVVVVILNVTQ